MNNKMFNLNHKSDYYLMNNYEYNFNDDANDWNNDNIINLDDNIPINDDYDGGYVEDRNHLYTNKNELKSKGNKYK